MDSPPLPQNEPEAAIYAGRWPRPQKAEKGATAPLSLIFARIVFVLLFSCYLASLAVLLLYLLRSLI